MRYGAEILSAVRRRQTLTADIEGVLRDAFEDRVPSFDSDAAKECACIAAVHRSVGRIVMPADSQIAAIASSRGLAVATRSVRDFQDTGVQIVNPWTTA